MTDKSKNSGFAEGLGKHQLPGQDSREPDWANGLRQLYDSVVDEPLPDSFNDLLAQLDEDSLST